MPKKGDDFDSLTAITAIEHNSNADITLPDATVIRGVFAREYIETGSFEGYAPIATIKDTDYPDVAHDDVLVIKGKNYLVTGIQPDGAGITNIVLHEA